MPTPRRVLHVITPSHMSGAEMQLVRLTKQMTARGHKMPVAVRRGSAATPEFRKRGVPVDEISVGGKANPAALFRLRRAFRDSGAQLIHSHLSSASWWSGWLESVGGPPSVGHVQGFTWAEWHRRQSHLLAVSGAVRNDLVAQGIDAEKITVLNNALSPDEFVPQRDPLAVRAELGADADTPVVGSFGHLSIKKGYRELFAAMPAVLKRNPRTQFWVIGQGKLKEELEAEARRGGFLSSVRFTGFRRDAADLMNAIDVMA
ncbi:MAG: glycosyltransferase, partial [Planctomycetota bacterium]